MDEKAQYYFMVPALKDRKKLIHSLMPFAINSCVTVRHVAGGWAEKQGY